MILITIGTIVYPFDRSITWLQTLIEQKIINEPVLLQHGDTSIEGLDQTLVHATPWLNRDEMNGAVREASLVISHAGQGSTRMLADMGARFVLLPRLKCYGEHVDDHQLYFARSVENLGVPHCTELPQLKAYILNPPPPLSGKLFDAPLLVDHLTQQYR
jgi:UDP-N-acetylglucosamine transferase subunit ALG13